MSFNYPNVCVLGASGFIGSAITRELDKQSISWIGVDYISTNPKIILIEELEKKIPKGLNNASLFINATGALKPNDCENDIEAAYRITNKNIDLICALLSRLNAKKILHISSAGTVYGEGISRRFDENSSLNPISTYGKIKVLEERNLEKYAVENDLKFLCARLSNPYGNKLTKKHGLIDVLIKSAIENQLVSIYSDRDPSRDYIHIDDAACYIVNLLLSDLIGYFNVCSGECLKVSEILDIFMKNNYKLNLKKSLIAPAHDVINNDLCNKKINSAFQEIKPKTVCEYIGELNLNSINSIDSVSKEIYCA